jgi:hypothetical protein
VVPVESGGNYDLGNHGGDMMMRGRGNLDSQRAMSRPHSRATSRAGSESSSMRGKAKERIVDEVDASDYGESSDVIGGLTSSASAPSLGGGAMGLGLRKKHFGILLGKGKAERERERDMYAEYLRSQGSGANPRPMAVPGPLTGNKVENVGGPVNMSPRFPVSGAQRIRGSSLNAPTHYQVGKADGLQAL